MGLAYLFALVVALGILILQILMGGRHAQADGDAHDDVHDAGGEPASWTLLLSLRFWIFAALGFGVSGSLIDLFALASPVVTFLIAALAALASGLFAVVAFRLLRRSSTGTDVRASQAVGRLGRVVVPCGPGLTGQVRVELAGASVDLLATTDGEALAKGEEVLVEDFQEGVARVSRRPSEL